MDVPGYFGMGFKWYRFISTYFDITMPHHIPSMFQVWFEKYGLISDKTLNRYEIQPNRVIMNMEIFKRKTVQLKPPVTQ